MTNFKRILLNKKVNNDKITHMGIASIKTRAKQLTQNKYILVLLFLAVNLLIYGYTYSANTYQSQDFPFIHKTANPSLYPHDLFMNTIGTLPSLYITLMAFIQRFVPLEGAYCIVYLLIRFIFFLALYNLTYYIFNNKHCCVLALFLFSSSPLVNAFGLFGDEPLMKSLLYHSSFTIPFLLWAIYLFLRGRYIVSLFLLAVCYYFSGLLANYVLIMFLFGSIAVLRTENQTSAKSKLWVGWLIFSGFWVLVVFWVFTKMSLTTPSADFIRYLKNWYAGHYFPLSWDTDKWRRSLTYAIFFIVFLYDSTARGNKRKVITYFLYGIYAMWFLGFVFGVIRTYRLPIILQFLRSDIFFTAIGIIFATRYIQKLMFSASQKKFIMGSLLILTLIDINLYQSMTLTFILGVFIMFYIRQLSSERRWFLSPTANRTISLLFRLSVLLAFIACVIVLLRNPFQIVTYLLIIIFLGFLFIAESEPYAQLMAQRSARYLYCMLFIITCIHFNLMHYRMAERRLSYYNQIIVEWTDLQQWARNNTADDALFIVPPYINGFRAFSQRSVFIEKLDGGFMQLKPGFEVVWAKRLNSLGYGTIPYLHFDSSNLDDPRNVRTRTIYAANNEDRFIYLKRHYNVDFVVEESFRALSFPLVYRNTHFLLYRIP